MIGGPPSQWEPGAALGGPIPSASARLGRGSPCCCCCCCCCRPRPRAGEAGGCSTREQVRGAGRTEPGVGCCVLGPGAALRDLAQVLRRMLGGSRQQVLPPRLGEVHAPLWTGGKGGQRGPQPGAWGSLGPLAAAVPGSEAPRGASPWGWPPTHIHRRGGSANCTGPNFSHTACSPRAGNNPISTISTSTEDWGPTGVDDSAESRN